MPPGVGNHVLKRLLGVPVGPLGRCRCPWRRSTGTASRGDRAWRRARACGCTRRRRRDAVPWWRVARSRRWRCGLVARVRTVLDGPRPFHHADLPVTGFDDHVPLRTNAVPPYGKTPSAGIAVTTSTKRPRARTVTAALVRGPVPSCDGCVCSQRTLDNAPAAGTVDGPVVVFTMYVARVKSSSAAFFFRFYTKFYMVALKLSRPATQ